MHLFGEGSPSKIIWFLTHSKVVLDDARSAGLNGCTKIINNIDTKN